MADGGSARIWSTVIASFRMTFVRCPNWRQYRARLKTKLSKLSMTKINPIAPTRQDSERPRLTRYRLRFTSRCWATNREVERRGIVATVSAKALGRRLGPIRDGATSKAGQEIGATAPLVSVEENR